MPGATHGRSSIVRRDTHRAMRRKPRSREHSMGATPTGASGPRRDTRHSIQGYHSTKDGALARSSSPGREDAMRGREHLARYVSKRPSGPTRATRPPASEGPDPPRAWRPSIRVAGGTGPGSLGAVEQGRSGPARLLVRVLGVSTRSTRGVDLASAKRRSPSRPAMRLRGQDAGGIEVKDRIMRL
jgi:hypothetical protein